MKATIDLLQKQLTLHRSLNELAVKKTEILKANDVTALAQIINEEQKHIQAIVQLTEKHGQESLADRLSKVSNLEQQELTTLKAALLSEIERLKIQNGLNQQLIEHSLQFVNLSLDLLLPQPASVNYGRAGEDDKPKRSLFDSQA